MQTSYSVEPDVCIPGQVFEAEDVLGTYACSEAIPFGRAVELHTDGFLRLPQGTTIGKIVGVSMFSQLHETVSGVGNGYLAGEMVSVLRKGRIAMEWTGTTHGQFVAQNIRHSSTIATHRGKLTDAAIAAGAGVEISAAPDGFIEKGTNANAMPSGVAVVELNLPA